MRFIHKIILLLFLLTNTIIFCQTPGFNYQALILNTTEIQIPGTDVAQNKVPLGLEDVTLRFTITNVAGIEYIEEQTVTTDENGMVSLIVGEGTPISSTFDQIDWDGNLKYLNVELNILSNNEDFIFLDTQKILYIPHPNQGSNVKTVIDPSNLTPPFETGDLIWVTNFGPNKNPTLMIWNGTNWMPVSNDFDPTNELGLVVAADTSVRSRLFPSPVTGDQVWNESCSCIEVFDGTDWVSSAASSTNVSNGLYKDLTTIKLGGPLTEPTEITTTATNTLAIRELEQSNIADDEVVVLEKETGILRKTTASSIIKQEEVVFFASDGQLQFTTPIPITDQKKIDVYRNGVKIDFTAINSTTIELEPDAICYKNDKIRIVQLH